MVEIIESNLEIKRSGESMVYQFGHFDTKVGQMLHKPAMVIYLRKIKVGVWTIPYGYKASFSI